MNNYRLIILVLVVVFATLLRFLPHPPNFTPIIALSIFAGVFISDRKWALLVPVSAMLVTDLFLGWHNTIPYVYASLLVIVLVGRSLRYHKTALSIFGGGVGGTMLFFIITNFGVWLSGSMYPKTWEGVIACYIAAVPFLHYMMLGTLFYSAVFFGVFYIICKIIPAIEYADYSIKA